MEELDLENSLFQQAKKFQQVFYELCSDYHTFCCDDLNEGIEHLKNFIGYTLFGLHLPAYNNRQIQTIEMLYNKIIKNSNATSTVYCGLIFNVVYFTPNRENAYNCIYPVPIFKVGNFRGDNHKIEDDTEPLNITYIDIGGRVYKNWQEYLAKNTLKNMTMILPYEGIYSLDPAFRSGRFASSVRIEKIPSQITDNPNYIMKNYNADMTLVSGGVSILLGGCWQNSSVKDHRGQNLPVYVRIDNITIHGLLDTFDPLTMNENYIKYGNLNGTDVLKLSKHLMYIGNCIVSEEVFKNLLMHSNDGSILFEYEAQLREVRHTTEHLQKKEDAPNNVEENSQQNKLIIRELKIIKTREDMLTDLIIYCNITEIINREDPFKFTKYNPDEDKAKEIKEEPTVVSVGDSVKPYIHKVLKHLRTVFGFCSEIPRPLMIQLIRITTGIQCSGIVWISFEAVIAVVSAIIRKVGPDELECSVANAFILLLDIVVDIIKECTKIIEKITSLKIRQTVVRLIHFMIDTIHLYIRSKKNCIAKYISKQIQPCIT